MLFVLSEMSERLKVLKLLHKLKLKHQHITADEYIMIQSKESKSLQEQNLCVVFKTKL